MENFTKMCLEYKKMENNLLTHKRQHNLHTINKAELSKAYTSYLRFQTTVLKDVNAEYDDMGWEDLKNYEKWLVNVREE